MASGAIFDKPVKEEWLESGFEVACYIMEGGFHLPTVIFVGNMSSR